MKISWLCGTHRLGLLAIATLGLSVRAQNVYLQHNLVSDLPGVADHLDTNLVNPWGIAFSATSPFWISDNHSGLSTLYDSTGGVQSLVVTIPPPAGGTPPAAPTGIIFNSTTDFPVVAGTVSKFIFSSEDGTITAWASGAAATLEVDNSGSDTIYKGLAWGSSGGANYLYATDFHNGKVDVFDAAFKPATLAGSFADSTIPVGFAPFNIWNIGGQLYVTYAKQDADAEDDVAGPGNGYINIFDTAGNLVKRFASQGPLNSPWGLAMAPGGFGQFGGTLLVGNFGDGMINAFDPGTGASLGALKAPNGNPIAIEGLWSLSFGNGGKGGSTNTLYFTAGIAAGGEVEDHGLFGSIAAVPPPNIYLQHNLVSDLPGMADHLDTNLVNPWGIAFSATSPFWISDNHSGLSTLYDSTGGVQSLVVTIPPPAGGTPPAAPTGIIFNNTTNFPVVAGTVSKFIFSSEDGTITAWASGAAATIEVDNSGSDTIYKGLAWGSSGGANYLYATDFHNGKVDVFDAAFKSATLAGSFADSTIPVGFAPFNIWNIGGQLYVTYAKQDADAEDDVAGPGNGYINIFDTAGNLVKRFASQGPLNSPWGLAMAPGGFGQFGGALLVGNFGDGMINAFDPGTGASLGALKTPNGNPIAIEGLWALAFGNGGKGGSTNTLYFTAGIAAGGQVEDHGLFGSIAFSPGVIFTDISTQGISLSLSWAGGTGPYLLQKKASISDAAWTDVSTTSDHGATVPNDGKNGFFRITDTAPAAAATNP